MRDWTEKSAARLRRGYFVTVSVPLTGIPQTVPAYVTTICAPVESIVALLLVKLNGQLTSPWLTRPFALQLIDDPDSVPAPEPITLMLPAQVAENVTFAADVVVGVTVYFRFPQPVGGVEGLIDVHVPANASRVAVELLGDVGVLDEPSFFLPPSRSHPAVRAHANARVTASLDFMIVLIVTYDFVLYGF
jgi:hypothetical protein